MELQVGVKIAVIRDSKVLVLKRSSGKFKGKNLRESKESELSKEQIVEFIRRT